MLWMGAGTWDRAASGKEGGSADQLSGRCRWSLSYATCSLKGDSHLGGAFWMGIFLLLSDGRWEEAVSLGGAWVFPHAVGLWEGQLCVCVCGGGRWVCHPERGQFVSKRGGDPGQGIHQKETDTGLFPPSKGSGLGLRPLLLAVRIFDFTAGGKGRQGRPHTRAVPPSHRFASSHLSFLHPAPSRRAGPSVCPGPAVVCP